MIKEKLKKLFRSKSKEQICSLDKEKRKIANELEEWKEITGRMMLDLKKHGVLAEIKYPEPEMIEITSYGDLEGNFISGITTEQPTVVFDFTNHDLGVIRKHSEEQP